MITADAREWPAPIRIVGLGSDQGDDALGWRIVTAVQRKLQNPAVHSACVATGAALLELLDGQGSLVVVDAVCSGGVPGSWHRYQWPLESLERMRHWSTHGLGLVEVLPLAQTLGLLPPRVEVWGVEIDPTVLHDQAAAAAAERLACTLVNVFGFEGCASHV